MRALLVVNPKATTTTERVRDVLTRALASDLDLTVAVTDHRDHAREFGRAAAREGLDLVVSLGGDGTVNEIVNGLLTEGPGPGLPRLAVVPGGSTNVFARALGLPNDVVEATGVLLAALREGRDRSVSLGQLAGPEVPARWFTFCAGLGFDAGVVTRVEAAREGGRPSTHALYLRKVVAQLLRGPSRRHGTITLERKGEEPVDSLVAAIVSNTSPWTYLRNRPVFASPKASFESDLDFFGLRRMSVLPTLRHGAQLLSASGRGPHGRNVVDLHDVPEFTLRAAEPAPLQVDGEALGDATEATFRSTRDALRVIV